MGGKMVKSRYVIKQVTPTSYMFKRDAAQRRDLETDPRRQVHEDALTAGAALGWLVVSLGSRSLPKRLPAKLR
jgi:hypothetical protein